MDKTYIIQDGRINIIHLKHLRHLIFISLREDKLGNSSKRQFKTLDTLIKAKFNYAYIKQYLKHIEEFINKEFATHIDGKNLQVLIYEKKNKYTQTPTYFQNTSDVIKRYSQIDNKIRKNWNNIGPKNSSILCIKTKTDYDKKLSELGLTDEKIKAVWGKSKTKYEYNEIS